MTEQYAQQNINNPAGARSVVTDGVVLALELSGSDSGKAIFVDTTAGGLTVGMPSASDVGAGTEITVVALTGAVNPVLLAIQAGDTLVTPAGSSASLATANASRILRSDGVTGWYIVAGLD